MKKFFKIGLPILYLILLYFTCRNLLLDTESFKEIVNKIDLNGLDFYKFKNILIIVIMILSIGVLFFKIILTSIINYYLLNLIIKDKSLINLKEHILIQIKLLLILFPKLVSLIAFRKVISINIIEWIFSIVSLILVCILYKKKIMKEDNKKSVILFLIVQGIITVILMFIGL